MEDVKRPPDYGILVVTITLACVGLFMIFSASSVMSLSSKQFANDSFYFVKRQAVWLFLGLMLLLCGSFIEVRRLQKYSNHLLVLSIILLIVVFFVGAEVNGAKRWINFGFLTLQPSELAKFAVVLYLASSLAKRRQYNREFIRGLLPNLIAVGLVFLLIEKEPDLGTALVVLGTSFVMLFLGGARKFHLSFLAIMSSLIIVWHIMREGYRMKRIFSFINPWEDPQGTGYHIIQSLLALGSGGIWGVGFGHSRQKFFYLPEQHTDFIFSVIGEELGLIGTLLILLLFVAFAHCGFKIAKEATDIFSSLLASGLTTVIVLQAFINMGVVSGLLPTTGIPLPFISYGGSFLLVNLFAVGLLVSISRAPNLKLLERKIPDEDRDNRRRDGGTHLSSPSRRFNYFEQEQ